MDNPARRLMMLNLKLRDEFLGSQMPGTAIALRRKDNSGAAQRTPDFILSITYPTADVQTALRAVSTDRSKRPIVLMGDRGRGKSHIMAVMHHAVESSSQVQKWANEWVNRLGAQPGTRRQMTLGRSGSCPRLWQATTSTTSSWARGNGRSRAASPNACHGD